MRVLLEWPGIETGGLAPVPLRLLAVRARALRFCKARVNNL